MSQQTGMQSTTALNLPSMPYEISIAGSEDRDILEVVEELLLRDNAVSRNIVDAREKLS